LEKFKTVKYIFVFNNKEMVILFRPVT